MSQIVVLLMGFPASGKSSAVAEMLKNPEGRRYMILSRDSSGGKVKDLAPKLREMISEGFSVILDNTFLTVEARSPFIEVAQELGVDIECHWMQTSFEDCQVNALHRMWDRYGMIFQTAADIKAHPVAKADPNMFPVAALFAAKKRLLGDKKKDIPSGKPTMGEGFSKIVKVAFTRRAPVGTVKAVIVDYDGTLRRDVKEIGGDTHYPTKPEEVEALPNRQQVLQRYVDQGYILLGVTTQSGIGKGIISEETAVACIQETNRQVGHDIHAVYCKHYTFPVGCYCRKPQTGLGVHLVRKFNLNPDECIYVGDLTSDATFAKRCGFQFAWADDFFRPWPGILIDQYVGEPGWVRGPDGSWIVDPALLT